MMREYTFAKLPMFIFKHKIVTLVPNIILSTFESFDLANRNTRNTYLRNIRISL